MIFEKAPADFKPAMDVVTCYLLHNNEFLNMQYCERKGATWGPPGGKRESHETRLQALAREIKEETGLSFKEFDFKKFKTVYCRYPDFDFIYSMYSMQLPNKPDILMDEHEHQNYLWTTPSEALKMDLIRDEDHCIELFFHSKWP